MNGTVRPSAITELRTLTRSGSKMCGICMYHELLYYDTSRDGRGTDRRMDRQTDGRGPTLIRYDTIVEFNVDSKAEYTA